MTAGVIRNTNFMQSGSVDYSDVVWLQVEQKQLARRQLRPGDIIVTRSGGGPKQHLLTDLFRPMLHQLMTAQIRVNDLDLPALGTAGLNSENSEQKNNKP